MTLPFKFDKARATEFLDCLANGKTIPAVDNQWTKNDMLQLAGACYCVVFSQGPMMLPGKNQGDVGRRPSEYREAVQETLTADILGSIEFQGNLSFMVLDDEYDKAHPPVLKGAINGATKKVIILPEDEEVI